MKRRNFLQSVGLASVGTPLLLKNFNFGTVSKELFKVSKSLEDRVLVLVRMNGGNDGLGTVIPLDQYDNLVIQRQNILIPENQLLNISTSNAFHPSMTGMHGMFNDGKLSVIQNVGYPEQNRSHFRSMDIWTSGLIDNQASTGWLGRHMDQEYPNFPDSYPNATYPDPFAISMGYDVSATCQGLMANFCQSVSNPSDAFNLLETVQTNDGTYYGSHMEYLSMIIAMANEYGDQINAAYAAGNNLSTQYDANNDLAMQLKDVAKMISGGLKTKVYVVNVNGFDTHDSQVVDGSPELGNHAGLLKKVSDAVAAFQNDLMLLGIEQRVAGMTFSEFGRQVASNASFGTDHGDAAPLFLFGSCISGGVVGPNPVIDNQIVDQAGLPMQIDFRDVYASVLRDWFGADETEIQSQFEHTITFFPVLDACNLSIKESEESNAILVYPNPCGDNTTIRFESENEVVTLQIRDINGKLVKEITQKQLQKGNHDVPVDLYGLPAGSYTVHLFKDSGNFTKRFVKVREM